MTTTQGMSGSPSLPTKLQERIFVIRGERVMLDRDLAELYGVPTKALNQAVRRNWERFPADFVFEISRQEANNLKSRSVISNSGLGEADSLKSQSVTSKKGRGGATKPVYAFTEHGVAMLASVLRSPRAVAVSIEIVRAFIFLRRLMIAHADLRERLDELEARYDAQFRDVFAALRQLLEPPEHSQGGESFGFTTE